MNLSWDTYIFYAQYSSSLCSVSAFHFSKANMSTVLFTVLIAFFIDLALTDLIFKTDSDEFVNLLMFKTVLTDSVWWWEQQKFKDLLLHFFVLIWVHFLSCNIVRTHWCLKCYIYENHWQSYWILNEKYSKKNISLILFNNYDVDVAMLLLLCHLYSVTREKHHSKIQSCYDFNILRCQKWNECKLYVRKSLLYVVIKQRDH